MEKDFSPPCQAQSPEDMTNNLHGHISRMVTTVRLSRKAGASERLCPSKQGHESPGAALAGRRLFECASVYPVVLEQVSRQWHCSHLGPLNHVSCALQDA